MKIGGFNWVNQSSIGPSNESSVDIAQNILNNTVARANKQLINALEVDGVRIFLYRRVLAGSRCPCSRQMTVKRDYNQTLHATSGAVTFEFSHGRDDGYNANLNDPDNSEDSLLYPQEDRLDGVLNEAGLLSEAESRLLEGSAGGTYTADATACGICMNTKRTQGYALFHGERIVLCASDDYPLSIDDSQFSDSMPQGFILSMGSTVTWDVELPTYAKAESVAVFNNRHRATNVGAWYSVDGGKKWEPLTKEAINKHNGKPKRWKIRAKQFDKAPENEFTHISIIIVDGKLPKAQAPNLTQDIVMEEFAAPIVQQWVFPPTMHNIERESVFYDCKHGYLWKVTAVHQQKTTTGQIFGHMVTARIIQPTEVFWPLHDSMLSTMDVAFRGLEEYQGGATVEENSYINRPMLDRVPAWTPYQIGMRGELSDEVSTNTDQDGVDDKCKKCPYSYNMSPTDGVVNQVVCTLGNCIFASNNSVVPDTILTKPVNTGHFVTINNEEGTTPHNGIGYQGRADNKALGVSYPFSPDTPAVEKALDTENADNTAL